MDITGFVICNENYKECFVVVTDLILHIGW